MIYLLLLASLYLDLNSSVIEQSDVSVTVSDFDSYIYLLPNDLRGGIANRPKQIEKNLITILNKNIVYSYMESEGLVDKEEFKKVEQLVEEKQLGVDDTFLESLDLDRSEFEKALRKFILKQEYYVRFKSYLFTTLNLNNLEQLAFERFLLNQENFKKPNKVDLSVIQLGVDQLEEEKIIDLIKSLRNNDKSFFDNKAIELSKDLSVSLNNGNWGEFTEESFNYPFSEVVFNANPGVIPNAFKFNDFFYIIRVNEVVKSDEPIFESYKEELMENLKKEIVEKKIQDIINQTGKEKIDVNVPVMVDIFERYKVFIKKPENI